MINTSGEDLWGQLLFWFVPGRFGNSHWRVESIGWKTIWNGQNWRNCLGWNDRFQCNARFINWLKKKKTKKKLHKKRSIFHTLFYFFKFIIHFHYSVSNTQYHAIFVGPYLANSFGDCRKIWLFFMQISQTVMSCSRHENSMLS